MTSPKPTPQKVLAAMDIIREHLKKNGWVQAIIMVEGGASFRLSDVHQDYDKALKYCMKKDK